MKKKVIKKLIGEAYDQDTGRNYPVYQSFWANDDGTYSRTEKIYVSEVEVPEKKKDKPKIEA